MNKPSDLVSTGWVVEYIEETTGEIVDRTFIPRIMRSRSVEAHKVLFPKSTRKYVVFYIS